METSSRSSQLAPPSATFRDICPRRLDPGYSKVRGAMFQRSSPRKLSRIPARWAEEKLLCMWRSGSRD